MAPWLWQVLWDWLHLCNRVNEDLADAVQAEIDRRGVAPPVRLTCTPGVAVLPVLIGLPIERQQLTYACYEPGLVRIGFPGDGCWTAEQEEAAWLAINCELQGWAGDGRWSIHVPDRAWDLRRAVDVREQDGEVVHWAEEEMAAELDALRRVLERVTAIIGRVNVIAPAEWQLLVAMHGCPPRFKLDHFQREWRRPSTRHFAELTAHPFRPYTQPDGGSDDEDEHPFAGSRGDLASLRGSPLDRMMVLAAALYGEMGSEGGADSELDEGTEGEEGSDGDDGVSASYTY